jgi:hypothetical protein
MLVFPDVKNFATREPLEQAREKILQRVIEHGGEIKVNSYDLNGCLIVAGFGFSLKRFLLGISLAGVKSIPRVAIVELNAAYGEAGDRTIIRIKVRRAEDGLEHCVNFIDWFWFLLNKNTIIKNWPSIAAAAPPNNANEHLSRGLMYIMNQLAEELRDLFLDIEELE